MNTTAHLSAVKTTLLTNNGLQDFQVQQLIDRLLTATVDAADIYFQATHFESWSLESGIIKEGHYSFEQGVGVRAICEDKTGFAYSDRLELPLLLQAVDNVKAITRQAQSATVRVSTPTRLIIPYYSAVNPLNSLTDQQKVDLLTAVDRHTRQLDSRIEEVMVSLIGVHEQILVINSEGQWAADTRPLVRMNVSVILQQQNRREQGSMGGGGRVDYAYFLDHQRALKYGEEALRQALVNLEADDAPAGTMPVVLGQGWPGILLHEAIGHGLEGDFNRKGTSIFSGRIGERVASPLCTVVDDGTLMNRRGSLTIDDEGTPTQCTVLIENGILKNYMQDKLNARLMGVHSTGNGRRESYAHLPMPRMTNTYLLPGRDDPEEIIRSVKKGLYAKNFGGGQVDITSGKFVFSASEAYLIENGQLTRPVKGAT
ncbi:MAG: metalloprotease TldD, partial [Pseudomonadota bacterium]